MKTASKVFLILDIITCCVAIICCIGFSLFFFTSFNETEGMEAVAIAIPAISIAVTFAIAAPCILPTLIINSIALHKLRYADCRDDILVIAILLLIFGNPLAGIFMLCISQEEFAKDW